MMTFYLKSGNCHIPATEIEVPARIHREIPGRSNSVPFLPYYNVVHGCCYSLLMSFFNLQAVLLRKMLSRNPDERPTTYGIRSSTPLKSFQVK